MHRHRMFAATLLFAFSAGIAVAQGSPSFTISATNITMATSDATIPFTLTSLNGYAGTVTVTCAPPSVSAGVSLPYCGGGAAGGGQTVTLKANAAASGGMSLHTQPYPVAARVHLLGHAADAVWAFAGVFLLGFGFCRRRMRGLSMLLLAFGMIAGLTGLTGCGAGRNNPNDLTPGVYTFTLTATDTQTNVTATTTARVNITPGIPR